MCVLLQAGFQFKSSLAELMTILMSKEPSYIRCIKPNDHKQPGEREREGDSGSQQSHCSSIMFL